MRRIKYSDGFWISVALTIGVSFLGPCPFIHDLSDDSYSTSRAIRSMFSHETLPVPSLASWIPLRSDDGERMSD
jgi:hypothetical protein